MPTVLLSGILLILAGALAAAALIAAKQPNAKAAIDKLVPFQGVIGAIAVVWGAYNTVMGLIHIGLITAAPVMFLIGFGTAVVTLALGFVLAYSLVAKYALAGSPEALAKGEQMRLKLVKIQTPLGLVAIGLGLWAVVFSVMNHVI